MKNDRAIQEKIKEFFSVYPVNNYKKGEIIIKPSGKINENYYLQKGLVRMYILSEEGEEITLHIFRPGTFFPIMLSMNNVSNKYYFEAIDKVEIRKAPLENIIKFLHEDTEVLYDLTSRFASAINGFLLRIESMTFEEAYRKMANLFLYLADRFGEKQGEDIVITIPLGHKDIANWIGIRRETVSRQFEKMQKDGIVVSSNKQLVIKDLKKLQTAGTLD